MKSKYLKLIPLVFALLITTFVVSMIGFLVAYIATHMTEEHTNDMVELYFQETGFYLDDFMNSWEASIDEYKIDSKEGYTIPIYYICPQGSYENKTIILVHWHEGNHVAMYPLSEIFLEKGWNVVLYDQRSHGKNTASTVSFGYLESFDLEQVVDFVKGKAKQQTIGALGQSMGASTVAYYSGSEHAGENLDFAIIDSPYNGMYNEIKWELTKVKIPLPATTLTSLGSVFCKQLYGYSFSDVDMVEQARTNCIPTLLMHSTKDHTCPYYMSKDILSAIPHENKKLITYDNSEHLFAFWDERNRYTKEVFAFIEESID